MNSRIQSVDFLKGMVIVLMALDHVRIYFHKDCFYFEPTDIDQTNFWIFFTRFITHYCAPVFVLLAGTSAFFVEQKIGKNEVSKWLVKRGLWENGSGNSIHLIYGTFQYGKSLGSWPSGSLERKLHLGSNVSRDCSFAFTNAHFYSVYKFLKT